MSGVRRGLVVLLLALAVLVNGCLVAPVIPPRGFVYTGQRAPLFGGKEVGTKSGRASAYSLLLLVAWGDASLDAAARNGGIRQIKHLDYEYVNVLGLYQKYTTIARGE